MQLIIENYATGFRVLNDNALILKAENVKWYRDAISYEYNGKKGLMKPLDLLGSKSNVIKDDRIIGEIIWNLRIPKNLINIIIVFPWFWGRYIYTPVNSSSSYNLEESVELRLDLKQKEFYQLIRTDDNEIILSITVLGGFISKPKILIDYHVSPIDEDLLAFAVFAFKSIQRGNRRPLYT